MASSVNEAEWLFSIPPYSPLTQSKNPIHLLPELDLDGRENSLGSVVLPFLVVETEDGAKPDVADVQYSNYC